MPLKGSTKPSNGRRPTPAPRGHASAAVREAYGAKLPKPPPAVADDDTPSEDQPDEVVFDMSGGAEIPHETYVVCTIKNFSVVKTGPNSKTPGATMFKVHLLIDEPDDFAGVTLWRNLPQTKAARGFTTNFANALGLNAQGSGAEKRSAPIKPSEIVGREIGAFIVLKNDEQYGERNEIRNFLSVEKTRERMAQAHAHAGVA